MKHSTALLALLCLITNVGWAYLLLDQGTTLSQQASEAVRQQRNARLLGELIVLLPRDVGLEEAKRLIHTDLPKAIVKKAGENLEVDAVVLEFRQDRLIRVSEL
jgi:hypothetical protein